MMMRPVVGSFTRPSDTATYAAGDVVCNSTSAPVAITFSNAVSHPGGGGVLMGAALIDGACQTLKGDFELWVFDTAPTMDNDNAAFTPTDAELQALVKIIPFGSSPKVGDATSGAGGNAVYDVDLTPRVFKCTASEKNLYGVLVVRNAYVPVSAGTFAVRLMIAQD